MNSKLLLKVSAVMLVLGLLSSCASNNKKAAQDLGTDQTGVASGKEIINAFDGGILPAAEFKKLSRKDKTRALLAEYRALEKSTTGQTVTWQNPNGKSSGTVTAAAPYQVGSQNCRQYTHIAAINGKPVQSSGAACRSLNGRWIPLR
jgi:surface antigen